MSSQQSAAKSDGFTRLKKTIEQAIRFQQDELSISQWGAHFQALTGQPFKGSLPAGRSSETKGQQQEQQQSGPCTLNAQGHVIKVQGTKIPSASQFTSNGAQRWSQQQ